MKKQLNYEDERKNEAIIINEINNNKFNENLNNNINRINDNKYNQLKKEYNKYIDNSIKIFKKILNKINGINSFIKKDNNNSNLNIGQYNNQNELYNIISFYLENIENYINNTKNKFLDIKKSEDNKNKMTKNFILNRDKIDFIKKENKDNEINYIYDAKKEKEEYIFGDKFVENIKNKIHLIINGKKVN